MVRKKSDLPKVEHPKVWIVWETQYIEGFAYEQVRAICTEEWIAKIDAQIVREEARNRGRRALVEVRPTLLNHLFGWSMIVRLHKESLLNPDVGTIEDFEKKLEEVKKWTKRT